MRKKELEKVLKSNFLSNKIEKSFNPKARDRVEFVEYVSLQKN